MLRSVFWLEVGVVLLHWEWGRVKRGLQHKLQRSGLQSVDERALSKIFR